VVRRAARLGGDAGRAARSHGRPVSALRPARFGQRAVDGRPGAAPAWEDDPGFDLDLHVHRRGIPAPGDRGALQEFVSDLVATPLDRSKPLWDIYLLEGYGAGARCSCACTTRSPTASPSGA
jgi:hypothetical protein